MRAIRHSGIGVRDMELMIKFYRDVLGFEIFKEAMESGKFIETILNIPGCVVRTVKMKADEGNLIELLDFGRFSKENETRNMNNYGLTHIAFEVEDVNDLHTKLKGRGIEFNSEPQVSPDGYAKVAFCRDPEGNLIELVEILK